MTQTERDGLILEAALEFGADCFYEVRFGTMGETLYIAAPHKAEASMIRQEIPGTWSGLYTVVLYPTHILCGADVEKTHKPSA